MACRTLRKAGQWTPLGFRRWVSRAAAVPLTEPINQFELEAQRSSRKAVEDVKVSRLGNGITVASLESHAPCSTVSILVRAGSRYETYDQHGLTHLLRRCAFLGTEERTAFGIAREMDLVGASLSATSTREHLIYSADFLRGNLDLVVNILGSSVAAPKFDHWAVRDQRANVELDVAAASSQPQSVVLEELHRAAFRNTLSNSLYCPLYNLSKFTDVDLKSYMREWFTGKRVTIVGVGTGHDELVACAQSSPLSGMPDGLVSNEQPSEYVGGCEVHIPSGSSLTHAVIACKGASLSGNQTDILAAGVLQNLLGATHYIKWGSNTATARLSKAAASVAGQPHLVSALNLCHSDNGLFGMYAVSDGRDSGKILRALLREFTEVAKGNVTDADLARAKSQLKASYLMSSDSHAALAEDIGTQASLKGSYVPLAETTAKVDGVTKDDVVKFAKAVFASRATFVAHGDLSCTPRLDQLLSEVSLK